MKINNLRSHHKHEETAKYRSFFGFLGGREIYTLTLLLLISRFDLIFYSHTRSFSYVLGALRFYS